MPDQRPHTDLGSFNNDWYKPGASTLKWALWHVINVLVVRNTLNPVMSVKRFWLRAFGARIGRGLVIKTGVNIKYPWRLTVGDNVWIGENVWIDNLADVTIGNNVCISQGAMLLTGNHNFKKTTFDLMVGNIDLEDGVWIGAQSVVCPGVRCGSHAILSVGSVTAVDLAPYTIYRGNPAQEVRKRDMEP